MIAIIDYGMGNLRSVEKAFQRLGSKVKITSQPEELLRAEKIVLPGVGAFRDAIIEIKKRGLIKVLKESVETNKPLLGICLGMQLLFSESEEARGIKGLSILPGEVKRFSDKDRLKVPHIGWNRIKILADKKDCPLLKDIPDGSYMYFAHSYYPLPKDLNIIATQTDYGVNFSSMIWDRNIFGVQFHPEKSQSLGLKILENFVNL